MNESIDPKIIKTLTNLPTPNPLSMARRAHVLLGKRCSYKCGFCYYKDERNNPFFPSNNIIEYLKFLRGYGIKELEFTGGEPTEYPLDEMIHILKIAQSYPFSFERIAVITNGSGSLEYYQELAKNNVQEFLFSLHFYGEIYEKITGISGSYNQIKRAIREVAKMGRMIRLNIVICKENYNKLVDFADHLFVDFEGIRFDAINFLPANTWGNAGNSQTVSFSDYKNILPTAINKLRKNGFAGEFAIRYVPQCELHESIQCLAKSHYQHVFDRYDWNQELDGHTIDRVLLYGRYGAKTVDSILEKRLKMYTKSTKCLYCSYFNICDGYQNEYYHYLKVNNVSL